jgi:broad specificity phosphatase PhoE
MRGPTCNMLQKSLQARCRRCVLTQCRFLLLLILIAILIPQETYAFQALQYTKSDHVQFTKIKTHTVFGLGTTIIRKALRSDNDQQNLMNDEDSSKIIISNPIATRRDAVIQSSTNAVRFITASSIVGVFNQQQQSAFAAFVQEQATTTTTSSSSNSVVLSPGTDCLQDLPVLDTTNFVRIYLCRHGQTELNRLEKIQGVRLNPSINDTGMKQAFLLGQALALANNPPELYYSSSLERAKVTASVAMNSAIAVDNSSSSSTSKQPKLITETVPSLMEIDFGPIAEGVPVEEVRAKMISTYAQWALGNINARMDPEGESGYEVLQRIETALKFLVNEACKTSTGTIVAVAHSVYLRVLLSCIGQANGFVAIQSPTNLKQSNCCVNVIDFPRAIVSNSISSMDTISRRDVGLFNRLLKSKKSIAEQGKIISINENRHLGNLA